MKANTGEWSYTNFKEILRYSSQRKKLINPPKENKISGLQIKNMLKIK